MKQRTIPWAAPGQSLRASDSANAFTMERAGAFPTRAIAPRPTVDQAEPPDVSRKEWKAGATTPSVTKPSAIPGSLEWTLPSNAARARQSGRAIARLLDPLDDASTGSTHLVRQSGLPFERAGDSHELPRYRFIGPHGGGDALRIGIFAAIHGDEPESGLGLLHFLRQLARHPETAEGFVIHAYPVCNPTGYEDATRHARGGKDLNREFWRDSGEPEVRLLEEELRRHRFHGIISLHCDDTSHGLYGFLSGRSYSAVLSASLLEPALRAAEAFLPRNFDSRIDGFHARGGILSTCYDGVLRAPDGAAQPPFEITFETPQRAEAARQVEAFNAALHTILAEFRCLQTIGQGI